MFVGVSLHLFLFAFCLSIVVFLFCFLMFVRVFGFLFFVPRWVVVVCCFLLCVVVVMCMRVCRLLFTGSVFLCVVVCLF